MRALLSTLPALALLTACDLGALGLFGEEPECRRNSDCDDDEDCDDGECVPEDDDDPVGEGEGEGEGDPPPDPEGPQFLQFSTNIATVRNFDTVIFTAVLTDPDGIDDIIGGSLVNPGNDAAYGSFQTSAAEGSYEISVSWNAMNTVAPIDFASTLPRQFTARFFDVAGHVSERTITVTLTCDGDAACDGSCGNARCGDGTCTGQSFIDPNGNGLCGNTCQDLTTATNCGECGNSCGDNQCVILQQDGLAGICSCGAGDCGGGQLCMGGVLDGSNAAICDNGFVELDVFNQGQPTLDAFGQEFRVCGINSAEAQLLCARDGQSGGVAAPGSSGSEQGFDINCTGVSNLDDCVYTFDDSCVPDVVTCGDVEPPPPQGDFSCATSGEVFEGSTNGSVSGSSFRAGSCAGTGPEDIYFFTPTETRTYTIDTSLSSGDPDTVLYVQQDCVNPVEFACNDQFEGNRSLVNVALTAGVPVLVVVDNFSSGSLSYTLRIQ